MENSTKTPFTCYPMVLTHANMLQAAGSGLGTPLYDPFLYWLGASVGRTGGAAARLLIGSLFRLSMFLSLVLRSRLM